MLSASSCSLGTARGTARGLWRDNALALFHAKVQRGGAMSAAAGQQHTLLLHTLAHQAGVPPPASHGRKTPARCPLPYPPQTTLLVEIQEQTGLNSRRRTHLGHHVGVKLQRVELALPLCLAPRVGGYPQEVDVGDAGDLHGALEAAFKVAWSGTSWTEREHSRESMLGTRGISTGL